MAEMLVIQLDNAGNNLASWVVADSTGAIVGQAGTGTLAEASAIAANRNTVALLPATDVLRSQVNIPLKGSARIQQALPYAMEEQLAQDIESLHFSIGERDQQGLLSVAVCETDYLTRVLKQLDQHDIQAVSAFSVADALPETGTTVWINNGRITIKDESGALAADTGELDTLLELRFPLDLDEEAAGTHVHVFADDESLNQCEDALEKLRLRVEQLDIKRIEHNGIAQLANGLGENRGVDLRQGPFAAVRENIALSPAWRIAAALLAAFCLLIVAGDALTLMKLKQQEEALDLAARNVLTKTFPSAANAADPWGQLQSRLRAAGDTPVGSAPGLIEALNELADAVDASKDIKVEALSFRGGVIDMRLEAPGVETLDKLTQTVNSNGIFEATIQSANPSGDIIQGRMQIKVAEQ